MNLVHDPRWGRAQEVYGEDVYLTSRLSVAYVQGQQGQNETETPYRMAARSACTRTYVSHLAHAYL
jgi:beta-glucosidase